MAAHAMFLLAVKCLQQANEKDKDRDLEVLIDGVVKSSQIKELRFSKYILIESYIESLECSYVARHSSF